MRTNRCHGPWTTTCLPAAAAAALHAALHALHATVHTLHSSRNAQLTTAHRASNRCPQFRTYLTRFLLLHDSTCARWWSELPAGSRRLSAPTWRQFRSSVDSGLVRDWSRNEALSANEGTPLSLCYSLIERFGATGQDSTILVQLAILFSLLGTAGACRRAPRHRHRPTPPPHAPATATTEQTLHLPSCPSCSDQRRITGRVR